MRIPQFRFAWVKFAWDKNRHQSVIAQAGIAGETGNAAMHFGPVLRSKWLKIGPFGSKIGVFWGGSVYH
jgi:hypothetical protein